MSSKHSGTGRIIIPSDTDRDAYIRRCYDTGRVAIISYGSGVIRQAAIMLHVVNNIEFPLTPEEYGSPVTYRKIPNREEYIIDGVYKENNNVFDISEYQFSIGRKTEDGISMIAGDASDGSMVVTVNHNKKGGNLTVNIGNRKTGGKMQFNISGIAGIDTEEFNINTYKKFSVTLPKDGDAGMTSISYVKGVGFNYVDEFGNKIILNKDHIQAVSAATKIDFGDGAEPLALAKTLKKLLDQLTDDIQSLATECAKIVVPTPMGNSGLPLNAGIFTQLVSSITSIKENYPDFFSKTTNSD